MDGWLSADCRNREVRIQPRVKFKTKRGFTWPLHGGGAIVAGMNDLGRNAGEEKGDFFKRRGQ